ncbi:MAG: choice-of-anchor J domain-containing protein, partial [Crocinitomicaceae bacterium]
STYAYMESSSPNYPSKTAILNSPCFDLSGQNGANLSFAYHMYGSSMGTLNLQVSTNGGSSWSTVWNMSGDQGDQWLTANVDLSAYAGGTIQLRFSGTTASSYRSDMAVDDISISAGSSCNTISSFPYTESFESSFGAWEQSNTDDFNWSRTSGGTPSNSTGPTAAAAGSFYAHVESSSPNHPNKTTILNSPCFDLSGQSGTSLSFAYHMYGASMGTLNLQVSTNGGSSWTSVWTLSGDQGNQWFTANVDLSAYSGSLIQLRYVGTTANSWQSDMSVDNINISESAGCNANTTISSFPYTESFESGFGAWEQSTDDDFNWSRTSGSTPSTATSPSSASSGSFYAHVESSSPNHPNKVTILNSPCFNLSGQSSTNLSFAYHMYGASMGTLQLQVSTNGGSSWSNLWSRTGDQGNQWFITNVNLNAYSGSTIQLRYVGTTANSWQSDMSIDNFSIAGIGGNDNDAIVENTFSGTDTDVLLYPNPADDFVIVDIQGLTSNDVNLYVLDMLGKEVYSVESFNEDASSLRISTSSFAPGTYMVIVRDSSGETYNKRLVIQ